MNSVTAYLALGSNQGDRVANLRKACKLLEYHPEIKVEARSKIYETQSVEGGGVQDFLNAAVRIETTLSPVALLAMIQAIESAFGRLPEQKSRGGARAMDVDILLFGDLEVNEDDLTIPHPRALRRAFMIKPLADVLNDGWVRESKEEW
ncbi:MAG TPA: 2-amino-4-hydroxy-6-hydroxymethyldihydropteridine diphosphokinase [Abditibacteriaceae bacterium]|jgi:2-amino-4-hydroxy-6-hydroxymethyldihydropteridine diphosphokinase